MNPNIIEKIIEEIIENHNSLTEWLGSVLAKIDRVRKEQKHYFLTIMLLQIINLILLVLRNGV